MKKYNFAIIGVTLLLSLSACNDWLDIDPSDQVSSEKLFESGGYDIPLVVCNTQEMGEEITNVL